MWQIDFRWHSTIFFFSFSFLSRSSPYDNQPWQYIKNKYFCSLWNFDIVLSPPYMSHLGEETFFYGNNLFRLSVLCKGTIENIFCWSEFLEPDKKFMKWNGLYCESVIRKKPAVSVGLSQDVLTLTSIREFLYMPVSDVYYSIWPHFSQF